MKKFILFTFAALSLSLPLQAAEYLRACHDNDSDYLKTALNIQTAAGSLLTQLLKTIRVKLPI